MKNCYNTGDITIINNQEVSFKCGGLIGECNFSSNPGWLPKTSLINCYAKSNISVNKSTDASIGGLVGYGENTGCLITINNSYSGYENIGILGKELETVTITNSEIKTETDMKTDEFVGLLDTNNEESKWKKDTENINKGYPILYYQ